MILHLNLPTHAEAIAFNRKRWAEVHADAELAASPNRIETNAWGQIIMTPPPGGSHCRLQFKIARELDRQLGGEAFTECPVSTVDGVRATDAAWYSNERYGQVSGQLAFEIAPEICVEVLSPRNTQAELEAKRQLYFAAGAIECWTCDLEGRMAYYDHQEPNTPMPQSNICPHFPSTIND
jgi:Uma2 family endonuclease